MQISPFLFDHPYVATAMVALLALLSGCGDGPSPGERTSPPPSATPLVERPAATVDGLVPIDAGELHLRCRGSGPATVVLVAGWGGDADGWEAVAPDVADTARVCSYDRFGTGRSDPPATTQTFATQADDLHHLLRRAGEPGPYVLVGHSFGGAEAVTFASRYPEEVTGVILIDASPTTWPDAVCSVPAYDAGCTVMHDPDLDPERLDVFDAFAAVGMIDSLGDIPLTVMTAAHRTDPNLDAAELARLDGIWADGVERWATLSTTSKVVSVEETGHDIQIDRPQIVIDEIRELLDRLVSSSEGSLHRRSEDIEQ